MADLTYWHEVEIPIRVTHYAPGRPDTFHEPGYGPEIEWQIDAPPEVAAWLLEQLGARGQEAITDAALDYAKFASREARSFARAVEHELSQWDRERQRQADYAYDPLRRDR